MRYYIKTYFHGWQEVSKEGFDRFVQVIRQGSTAIPSHKKDEYIKSITRIEERD